MKRLRSMRGLEIYRAKDGTETVGIIWYANRGALRQSIGPVGEPDPTLKSDVDAIKLRKRLDGKYKDSRACVAALRLLDQRRAEVKQAEAEDRPYLPPKLAAAEAERQRDAAAEAKAQAAKQANDARSSLCFETCAEKFLEDAASDYARPEAQRANVRMLSRYFAGRYLDEIGKADIRRYYMARLDGTAPFADLRRVEQVAGGKGWRVVSDTGRVLSKVLPAREAAEAVASERPGARVPRCEIDTLSAMYNYILDPAEDDPASFPALVRALAPDMENATLDWRSRRKVGTKAGKLEYTPEHEPVIPTETEYRALLHGAPTPLHRAAWALAYYTGARPESELCRVTFADVVYSDDPRARFAKSADGTVLGWITFRDTKTGEAARSVPLHPDAEAALKSAGLPEKPTRHAGESDADLGARIEAWGASPIFAKRAGRGAGQPWTRHSYAKAWRSTKRNAIAALRKADPEARDLSGMWVRDFRKASITDTRAAGTDGAVASKLAGHSEEMSFHYTQATDEPARAAILRLKRAADRIPDRIPDSKGTVGK